jgi:hypothetical protein
MRLWEKIVETQKKVEDFWSYEPDAVYQLFGMIPKDMLEENWTGSKEGKYF